jgi:alanine racemase
MASDESGTQESRFVNGDPGAWMEIDLGALKANYRELRRRVGPDTKLLAAVKANAYGHGAVCVARELAAEEVYAFGTGSIEDAVAIRRAGVGTKIILFGSPLPEAAAQLLREDVTPTICNLETALAVSEAAESPTSVFVKVDTGLGRLGVPLAEAVAFIRTVSELPRLIVEGVYTHLPFEEASEMDWERASLESFGDLVRSLAEAGLSIPVTQARSSAAVLAGIEDVCTAISPGHLLYGLPPASEEVGDLSGFEPVLRAVKTRLVQVTRHSASRSVGIGGRIQLAAGTVTGAVPFGRYHGYRTGRAQKAEMIVRGRRVPVIGLSLETTTIDLTEVAGATVGDEVVVLGHDGSETISLTDLASWQGVGILDVLMTLDGHLSRRTFGGSATSAERVVRRNE